MALDANGSLRITYGTTKSLRPESADPADRPFSVANQILAVDTGVAPFNAPHKLLAAIKARTFGPYADPALGGDLPIALLSDLDITGGNSGSPTLNARGELVGLLFDCGLEGVASDSVYDRATTRAISIDVRYMLWTMDLLDGGESPDRGDGTAAELAVTLPWSRRERGVIAGRHRSASVRPGVRPWR